MKQFLASIKPLVLGSSFPAIGAQFVFLVAVALMFIYWILRTRRDTVVVLSHSHILIGTILGGAASAAFYQGVLHWIPLNRRGWWLALLLLLFVIWRFVLNAIVYAVDRGQCLKDTVRSDAAAFNCNWQLVPRCTNQSLFMLWALGMAAAAA